MARASLPRSRRMRVAVFAWLLPALLLRALIPAGFMPAASAERMLALQMCSAGTVPDGERLRVDRESVLRTFDPREEKPLGPDEHDRAPCDFAVTSAGAAPPPAPAALVLATFARELRPQPLRELALSSSPIAHAQQPRAPPRYS